jgi:hypothetical protein
MCCEELCAFAYEAANARQNVYCSSEWAGCKRAESYSGAFAYTLGAGE